MDDSCSTFLGQHKFYLLEGFLGHLHWAVMWQLKLTYVKYLTGYRCLTNGIYCHRTNPVSHFHLFVHEYLLFSGSIFRSIMFLLLGNYQNASRFPVWNFPLYASVRWHFLFCFQCCFWLIHPINVFSVSMYKVLFLSTESIRYKNG